MSTWYIIYVLRFFRLCIFVSQGIGVGAVFGVHDIWSAVFLSTLANDPLAIPLAMLFSDCSNTLISM